MRWLLYCFVRTVLGAAAALGVFALSLRSSGLISASTADVLVLDGSARDGAAALARAQAVMLFALVFWFVASSATFAFRTAAVWREPPTRNRIWVACSVAVLALQVLHSLAVTRSLGAEPWVLDAPAACWALVFGFPVASIAVEELVKRHDKARFEFQMKRLRIHFDTRLGQYSPQ